jgi:hypothetical protein
MQITFNINPNEAAVLLRFLRTVLNEDVKKTLSTWKDVRRYDKASEKLRVALVKKLELGAQ